MQEKPQSPIHPTRCVGGYVIVEERHTRKTPLKGAQVSPVKHLPQSLTKFQVEKLYTDTAAGRYPEGKGLNLRSKQQSKTCNRYVGSRLGQKLTQCYYCLKSMGLAMGQGNSEHNGLRTA